MTYHIQLVQGILKDEIKSIKIDILRRQTHGALHWSHCKRAFNKQTAGAHRKQHFKLYRTVEVNLGGIYGYSFGKLSVAFKIA